MDKKMIYAIVAVVIIVVAAAAVVVVANNNNNSTDNDKVKPVNGLTSRCLVYGNADNSDTLNSKDLDLVKSIVKENNWDKKKNPYADANHDGKVDDSDVSYLQDLLDGKKTTKMWYVGSGGIDYYVNYPNTGNIAITVDYGFMMCQVLDVYDRITAGSTKAVSYDETKYPGCTSLKNLGSYSKSDYADFQESLMTSGCTIVLGYIAPALYESLRDSGKAIDQIQLSTSAQNDGLGPDVVASILTCGVLLGQHDEAMKYVNYADKMEEKFAKSSSSATTKQTFVVAYNTNNATTTDIDTHYTTGGCFGDVWTVSHLPMTDAITPTATGMTTMDIEALCKDVNPDIIIISMWGATKSTADPKEIQKIVDEKASYFKTSDAYKNGNIYAINYESMGTYMGLGALGVLASYIWPDQYDEAQGWNDFLQFTQDFSMLNLKSVDELKQLGGMIVYKMSTPSS